MKRRLVLLIGAVLAGACVAVPACNTIEGAGRDLQAIGKGTSDAARGTADAVTGKR